MAIAQQTLILFVLILVGILCSYRGILSEERTKALSDILVYVVTPCVLINSLQQEYTGENLRGLGYSLLLSFIGFMLAIILTGSVARVMKDEFAEDRFACIYPNCGYMGIPLVMGLFGNEGVFFLTAHIVMFNIIAYTHGVMLMEKKRGKINPRKFISAPIIGACAGLLMFAFNIKLPYILAQPVEMFAATNSIFAMLVAGNSIFRTDFKIIKKNIGRISVVCAFKLILFPLIYIPICMIFPVAGIVKLVSIIAMACPCAALGIIFTVMYGRDDTIAAEFFTLSTLLSIITLPLMVMIAGAFGIRA